MTDAATETPEQPEPAASHDAPDAETPEKDAAAAEPDWQSEARKWERRAKENMQKLRDAEPKVTEYDRLVEASKSDLERSQEELNRWQTEADRWRKTSVTSRIEALAAVDFAYPADAIAKLDPDSYIDAGGTIDEVAIKRDLDALLAERPLWRRQAEVSEQKPRVPGPNAAQGSGGGGTPVADPRQEFAAIIQGARG